MWRSSMIIGYYEYLCPFLDRIRRAHARCNTRTRNESGSPETQSTREETSSDANAVQTFGWSRRLDTDHWLSMFARYLSFCL